MPKHEERYHREVEKIREITGYGEETFLYVELDDLIELSDDFKEGQRVLVRVTVETY